MIVLLCHYCVSVSRCITERETGQLTHSMPSVNPRSRPTRDDAGQRRGSGGPCLFPGATRRRLEHVVDLAGDVREVAHYHLGAGVSQPCARRSSTRGGDPRRVFGAAMSSLDVSTALSRAFMARSCG